MNRNRTCAAAFVASRPCAATAGRPSLGPTILVLPGADPQTEVMRSRIGLSFVLVAAAAVVLYVRYVRPWQLTWGATAEEVSRSLPGDDLVARPTFNATSNRYRRTAGADLAVAGPNRTHPCRLVQL